MAPGFPRCRRLFDGRGLILSGGFVSLGELFPTARLIRGYNLYGSAGLELILTVNDDLFPWLQPAVD